MFSFVSAIPSFKKFETGTRPPNRREAIGRFAEMDKANESDRRRGARICTIDAEVKVEPL